MDSQTTILETSVDRLVSLVKEKKKISLADASKELGVSSAVINEWVEMFDGQGIIGIEYNFTQPFIVERSVSDKELERDSKQLESKKEIVVRKSEVNLRLLRKEGEKLKEVKEKFEKLKSQLGIDTGKLRQDLKELNEYIILSRDLKKDAESSKEQFRLESSQLENQGLSRKEAYNNLLSSMEIKANAIKKEKMDLRSMNSRVNSLNKKLSRMGSSLRQLEASMSGKAASIKSMELDLEKFTQESRSLKKEAEQEKFLHMALFKKYESNQKRLYERQNNAAMTVTGAEKNVFIANKAIGKMNDLFEKEAKLVNFADRLDMESNELEKSFADLIRKAKAFRVNANHDNIHKNIADLEKNFKETIDKKNIFSQNFKKFVSMFY